jgi:uncharacterized phage-associated protein
MDIQHVCDYIITRMAGAGKTLSVLTLQRLLYFAQGWHLAFYGGPFFEGRFQAWAQGPINRKIYDRFANRPLDSQVSAADVSKGFDVASVSQEKSNHIRIVLEAYAKCEDSGFNEIINTIISKDAPWLEARTGCLEHSQREIEEDNIRRFCIVLYLLKQFGTEGGASAQRQTFPVPAVPREVCEWTQELLPV